MSILKKLITSLGFVVISAQSMLTAATSCEKSNRELLIGGKIHFEEESGKDYLGTREINKITRNALHKMVDISLDICAPNAKVLLTLEDGKVNILHYEEKSRPGIGEDIHATLLYTKPRGFCDSETLEQVYDALFEQREPSLTIELIAKTYTAIIKPEWKFQITEVILIQNETNSLIIAELHFEGQKNIYKDNKPISAGLHLTLANCNDRSILANFETSQRLIQSLNEQLKGKMVKIAEKNGIADLEFGLSGCSWRIRAEERN